MGETPWDNPLHIFGTLPNYGLDRIRTPLLIVAGQGDNVVPPGQSRHLFVGLRPLDRSAQLAVYPGQGYAITDWSLEQAVDVSKRMVGFLEDHLRKGR